MAETSLWGVVGHEQVVRFLQHTLASGNLSHAYLFTGPHGIGKTTLARALASALLCQATPAGAGGTVSASGTGVPCGECRACRLVAANHHPDVHIVESEQVGANLKIESVRELQHLLGLTPVEGRWRVAILRRFEEATSSAANALLKTLEEPPPYVVLVVAAQEADLLLPTIVSRCQHLPLHPVPVPAVRAGLIERWEADPEQAELLAHLSGGQVGYALRLLADRKLLKQRAQRLDELQELLNSSLVERFRYAEALVYGLAPDQQIQVVQEILAIWTTWWRDVLLLAAEVEATNLVNVDRQQELKQSALRFGVERGSAVVTALCNAAERLKRNANPRLTLEVALLDLPRP